MKKLLALTALVLPLSSFAGEMALDLQFDEDGKATPVSTYAHDWNENIFSRVKYRGLSITETDTVTELTDAKSAKTVDEQFVQLSLLGYQQKTETMNWAVSGGLELIRIESNEFAYGKIPTTTDLFAIDTQVETTSTRPLVSAEVGYDSGAFSIKGGIDLKPGGSLSVKTDTDVEYTSAVTGSSDNSYSADLAYGVQVNGLLKTGLGFDFGFGAEYDLLPLKYDLAQLNATADAFETSTQELDEIITRYSVRFILGHKTDMGRPMIGMTQETLTTEQDGGSSEETINYLVLGFDRRF